MKRIQNVTLKEAHELVKQNGFALWSINGNFMNVESLEENVETRLFLGESIFVIMLSTKKEETNVIASRADLIDIWDSVKEKYPQLFEEGVKGDLMLIP